MLLRLMEPACRRDDQLRANDEQNEQGDIHRQEWRDALDDGFHLDAAHTRHHVQYGPYRRRNESQAAYVHEHEAEVDGVDLRLDGQRQAYGGEDQDGRRQIHGRTYEQQEKHHQGHEEHGLVHDGVEQYG